MDPRYSAVVSMSSTVFYKGGDIPTALCGANDKITFVATPCAGEPMHEPPSPKQLRRFDEGIVDTIESNRRLAAGAGEVGDEAREGESADALGAVGLYLLSASKRNAKALDKPFDRIALEDVVRTYPRGGKRLEETQHLLRSVVDASQQDSLRRDGYTAIHKLSRRIPRPARLGSGVDVHVRPHLSPSNPRKAAR